MPRIKLPKSKRRKVKEKIKRIRKGRPHKKKQAHGIRRGFLRNR